MSSSVSVWSPGVRVEDASGTPGIARYSQALESAIKRPGKISWEGVQEMCIIAKRREISSEEALSPLKPYIKSILPAVVLKALTMIDSLVINSGPEIRSRLAGRKWAQRLAGLAYSSDDKVRYSALQLFSNWSGTYSSSSFGEAYSHVIQELEERNVDIPTPLVSASLNSSTSSKTSSASGSNDAGSNSWEDGGKSGSQLDGFVPGLDCLNTSLTAQTRLSENNLGDRSDARAQAARKDELTMTSQRIVADVMKLLDLIQKCTDAAQAMKSVQGSRKDVLDSLNKAWVAAEKCNVWSESMQSYLLREMSEDDLARLLDANDRLNSGLERWQALVSLDVANINANHNSRNSMDDDDNEGLVLREIGSLSLRRRTSTNTLSEFGDRKLKQLQEQNDYLTHQLSEAAASKEAALAQAEAQFKKNLKEIKHRGVKRAKQLLAQIGELQEELQKKNRENEDTLGRLDSARQSLARAAMSANSATAKQLEAEVSQLRSELEGDRKRSAQREAAFQADIKKLRSQTVELEIQLADKESEIESCNAQHAAMVALNKAELERVNNELRVLRSNSKEVIGFKGRAEEAEKSLMSLKLELKRESILRKKAYNQIREMKGNIRVVARVRPAFVPGKGISPSEGPPKSSLMESDDYTLVLRVDSKSENHGNGPIGTVNKAFEFDACFGPEAKQEDVFMETADLIQSAFDGYNVCIFCYGQTGTGKTYTLTGDRHNPGIIPRAMESVFETRSQSETCSVSAYMLELYQDTLIDLLGSDKQARLKTKTNPSTGIVQVDGAHICAAENAQMLKNVFERGLRKRKTAATSLNIQSSRSHLIFTMLLERQNVITGAKSRSKMSFVDLAGSERVARSGAMDDNLRLNEAKAINKSLSALGDVVGALTSGESFIPYRNHKLTELMRDSLGGNAKTLMIVNVSPLSSDSVETRNSLDYATRVKQVSNEASRSFETREIARLKGLLMRNGGGTRQART